MSTQPLYLGRSKISRKQKQTNWRSVQICLLIDFRKHILLFCVLTGITGRNIGKPGNLIEDFWNSTFCYSPIKASVSPQKYVKELWKSPKLLTYLFLLPSYHLQLWGKARPTPFIADVKSWCEEWVRSSHISLKWKPLLLFISSTSLLLRSVSSVFVLLCRLPDVQDLFQEEHEQSSSK